MTSFHKIASTGFGRSASSGLYDRARPTYPLEALSKILATVPVNRDIRIAEYGAGTGIFTRLVLSSAPNIDKMISIEPSEEMRESFKSVTLPVAPPGKLELVEGTFQESPIKDSWADLIVIAQAFHWNADHHVEALKEFSRVLAPKSSVALIWNREDSGVEWVKKIGQIESKMDINVPQYRHNKWRDTFKVPYYDETFGKSEETWFKHKVHTTKEGVIERSLSKSYVSCLSEEEQKVHKQKISDIVDEGAGLVWVNKEEKIFEYPFETDLVTFQKK